MNTSKYILLLVFLLLFGSCQQNKEYEPIDQIVVHIQQEPQRLSPILATSGYERIVSEHVFLSLCDFDPSTLDMVPVLSTEVPKGISAIGNNGETLTSYDIEILPEAVWSDGTPITGLDFAFTMKILTIPYVNSPNWKLLLSSLIDISIDAQNPKKFTVTLSGDYFLGDVGLLTAEFYPAHIYDSEKLLSRYSYKELKEIDWESLSEEEDEKFKLFNTNFSSPKMTRNVGIEGTGPYTLESWETGQYLSLIHI